jgi:hypothetical protein
MAWSMVGSVNVETRHGESKLPDDAARAVVYKTPISSMWQSACGRFVLYPPDEDDENGFGFDLDKDELDYLGIWLPSHDWNEFYCRASVPGKKFNFRNRKYSFIHPSISMPYLILSNFHYSYKLGIILGICRLSPEGETQERIHVG